MTPQAHPLRAVESIYEHELRHDDAAERAVLGSILINAGAYDRVITIIDADDFFDRAHSKLFSAMKHLVIQKIEIDILTLKDELTKRGQLDQVGGGAYISSLMDGIPNVASVERYARIVASHSTARKATIATSSAAVAIDGGRSTVEEIGGLQLILDGCLKRESATNPESHSSLTPLADFLAEPAPLVDWLVDGLFLHGGIALVVAKPKSGKSTIARDAAFAVATGTPFLGRTTKRGKVLFLALEEHRDQLRAQFERMGFNGDECIFVHVGPAPEHSITWLRSLIAEHHPDLVVIDPVLKLIRLSDANAYAETSAGFEPLVALARESGACVLAVHHANKIGDGAGGESVLGSTAIFAAVDVVLLMKRRDDQVRTVSTIQRYGSDMPETVLEMDPDTGLLGIAGAYADVRIETVIRKITDTVQNRPGMTQEEIRDAVSGDRRVVAKALKHAVTTCALRSTGLGKKGSAFHYYVGGGMVAS